MNQIKEEHIIKELFRIYFSCMSGRYLRRTLKEFSSGSGFGREFVCCTFPSDYNEWEEGYFGKDGVKINIYSPAYEYDVYAVVTEEQFLNYLKDEVEEFNKNNPEHSEEINYYIKVIEKNLMINKK